MKFYTSKFPTIREIVGGECEYRPIGTAFRIKAICGDMLELVTVQHDDCENIVPLLVSVDMLRFGFTETDDLQ